jgi:hypothetical protein
MRLGGILGLFLLLCGCAPTAFTMATLATSGVTYLTTGKSVSDLTLSAMVHRDCELLRVVRGQPMCRGPRPGDEAVAATALADVRPGPAYNAGPWRSTGLPLSGITPAAGPVGGGVLGRARPAEGAATGDGSYVIESGGERVAADASTLSSGTALLEGFSERAEVFALIQDDGALEVFVHDPTRAGADLRMVFTIEGYGASPDAFSGVWINGAFHFIGNILA